MNFEIRINKTIDEIIKKYDLPVRSIYLFSNVSTKGKNKGIEISKSICINEPVYPSNPNTDKLQSKSYVIMNIQNQSCIELLIRINQFNEIAAPDDAVIKELKSDVLFKHVVFNEESNNLYDYIKENIIYCIDNYEDSYSFGCCSQFEKCSDLKRCIHGNKLYAKGCSYRKNLEEGKIFYGLNRNIV